MAEKLSVIIITKNEEKNIRDCLESIKWADEIIVVDAFSNDRTIEIAKEYTTKVFQREWIGFADQKDYALSLATNEWILSLDADERVSHTLRSKIQEMISGNSIDKYDGYLIKRDNYFLGRKIRSCGWNKDFQLRLFRKSKTRLTNRLVHEGFEVSGQIGKISEPIIHLSYKSFNDAFSKINNYSTLEALEKSNRQKASFFTIVFFPIIYFLQHFIFRYGFIDGIYGFFVSLLHAWTKMLVQLKIWELQHKSYEER
jgi:glycosyltransferase involved in cell wall biosynthesis